MKLRPEVLTKYVLSRIGVKDPAVLIGPTVGEDSAVIDLGNGNVLVIHSDPITGAVEYLGWLAIHVPSNDVAVTGAKPRWFLPVIYLPEGVPDEVIDKITSQMDLAAKELRAMIVGGHTEYTPGIERPMVAVTALGIAHKESIVRTGGAVSGDLILMTKTAGIEGTSILATDFKDELKAKGVGEDILSRAKEFIKYISVVHEALTLTENVHPNSMHDPTEGGVIAGLLEMAYASKKTFIVYEDRIRIAKETAILTKALGIDPLKLISSGTLLATIPPSKANEALRILREAGVDASIIGVVKDLEKGKLLVLKRTNGAAEVYYDVYVEDELMRLWSVK
ncbi:MAG TPA: hydrogenase assembly protein HupF, partial [Acidilobales archaeon]|nr:hydrogenase assembly protein HupF [Acidilobales archaeon]